MARLLKIVTAASSNGVLNYASRSIKVSMMSDQPHKARQFRELHVPGRPLVLFNVWDAGSAKAVTAGGASGNPASPHFNDQAKRYSTGDLRDVYFYRSDLKNHIEREYHPGK